MPNISISLLSQDDKNDCAKMFCDVFTSEPFKYEFITSEVANNYMNEIFGNPIFRGYKLDIDNKTIGYCVGDLSTAMPNSQYTIKEIFIDNVYQSKGYGKTFLIEINEDLANMGTKVFSLYTNRNIPAYKFYESLGFIEIKDTAHFMMGIRK